MTSEPPRPAARIETARLVVRRWHPDDAPLLRDAIDSSLEHLRPWMPWVEDEPKTLEETREYLEGARDRFDAGEDFTVGLFDRDETGVLGAAGLHPRIGADGLEIGYWIRSGRTGDGLATEAARALTDAGFGLAGIDRMEIHCDPENAASRRVPEKLGYELVEHREGDFTMADGSARDTVVYRMTRAAYLAGRRPEP